MALSAVFPVISIENIFYRQTKAINNLLLKKIKCPVVAREKKCKNETTLTTENASKHRLLLCDAHWSEPDTWCLILDVHHV